MSYLAFYFDQMSYSTICRIDELSYSTNCRIDQMVFDEMSWKRFLPSFYSKWIVGEQLLKFSYCRQNTRLFCIYASCCGKTTVVAVETGLWVFTPPITKYIYIALPVKQCSLIFTHFRHKRDSRMCHKIHRQCENRAYCVKMEINYFFLLESTKQTDFFTALLTTHVGKVRKESTGFTSCK